MHQRKLSDILIEIATQGLKDPEADNHEVIHPLMWLAHVAWNREVGEPDYGKAGFKKTLAKFPVSKSILKRVLIVDDWKHVLEQMRAYKRFRFPDDVRYILRLGVTPHGTLRVEFKAHINAGPPELDLFY